MASIRIGTGISGYTDQYPTSAILRKLSNHLLVNSVRSHTLKESALLQSSPLLGGPVLSIGETERREINVEILPGTKLQSLENSLGHSNIESSAQLIEGSDGLLHSLPSTNTVDVEMVSNPRTVISAEIRHPIPTSNLQYMGPAYIVNSQVADNSRISNRNTADTEREDSRLQENSISLVEESLSQEATTSMKTRSVKHQHASVILGQFLPCRFSIQHPTLLNRLNIENRTGTRIPTHTPGIQSSSQLERSQPVEVNVESIQSPLATASKRIPSRRTSVARISGPRTRGKPLPSYMFGSEGKRRKTEDLEEQLSQELDRTGQQSSAQAPEDHPSPSALRENPAYEAKLILSSSESTGCCLETQPHRPKAGEEMPSQSFAYGKCVLCTVINLHTYMPLLLKQSNIQYS